MCGRGTKSKTITVTQHPEAGYKCGELYPAKPCDLGVNVEYKDDKYTTNEIKYKEAQNIYTIKSACNLHDCPLDPASSGFPSSLTELGVETNFKNGSCDTGDTGSWVKIFDEDHEFTDAKDMYEDPITDNRNSNPSRYYSMFSSTHPENESNPTVYQIRQCAYKCREREKKHSTTFEGFMVKNDGTCWCSKKRTDSCSVTQSADTRQYNFLKHCKDFELSKDNSEEWKATKYGEDREACVHTKTCSEFTCQGIYKDKSDKSDPTGFSSSECCDVKTCDEDVFCDAKEGYILIDGASGTTQSEHVEGVSNCCRKMECVRDVSVRDVTSANLAAYVRKTDGGSCSDNTSTTKKECNNFIWKDAHVEHGKNLDECYELKKCHADDIKCITTSENPTGRTTVRETSTTYKDQKNDCCTEWDKFNRVETPQKLDDQFEGFINNKSRFVRFIEAKEGYKCSTGNTQAAIGGMLPSVTDNLTQRFRDHCAKTCSTLNTDGFSTGPQGDCECLTGNATCEEKAGWKSFDFTLNTNVDCEMCTDDSRICTAKFDCEECDDFENDVGWKQCRANKRGFFGDHTCKDVRSCPDQGSCSKKGYTNGPACVNGSGVWTSIPGKAFKVNRGLDGSTAETCCVRTKCKEIKCGSGQKPSNVEYGYTTDVCCIDRDIWDLVSGVERIGKDGTTTDFIVEKTVSENNEKIDKTCSSNTDCHAYFSCADMGKGSKCYKDAIIPGNSCMNWTDVDNFENTGNWKDQICRNMNGEKNRPWCYINDTTWSYC